MSKSKYIADGCMVEPLMLRYHLILLLRTLMPLQTYQRMKISLAPQPS